MQNIVEEIKRLRCGDLVEIALTANAARYSESHDFYMHDYNGTNVPGRTRVGYVSKIRVDRTNYDFIWLAEGWNKLKDKIDLGGAKYYLDAIEDITCLRRSLA